MANPQTYNVLFLCTGNSARSIIAEATLNAVHDGRFKGYSAGSHPGGVVNPLVLEFLATAGVSAQGARSKSWQEFARPGAPRMDFVITVCDSAASEACPLWPGHPVTAHWGVADPALHMHDAAEAKRVIADAYRILRGRIVRLLELPLDTLDAATLKARIAAIGREEGPSPPQ